MNQHAQEIRQLEPELLTIDHLFDDQGTFYTVPIYQRNYAWQAEQIEQLLSDIQGASREEEDASGDETVKKSYFLGNLMVTKHQGAPTNFEVIDGQQRLTTIYLILAFLVNRGVTSKDYQSRLRYESRPRATEALRHASIEASRPSAHSPNTEDTGIHQAYNVIQQFMDQHITGKSRRDFAEFLLTKVTVVRASLPPKTDFNRYFEIMNTRGQQLQQVDIIKARLMAHLASDAERDCFAWIWDACADMGSYVQMSLKPRDKGLSKSTEPRTEMFGEDWSWLSVSSFEKVLAVHERASARTPHKNLSSGSLTLSEAIAKYEEMGTTESSEDQDNVRFRSTIEFPAFLLHVLNVMNSEDDEEDDEGKLDDKALVRRFTVFLDRQTAQKSCWVRAFAFELLRCRNLFDSYILKRQYFASKRDDGDWSLQRLINRQLKNKAGYVNTFSRGGNDAEEDGDLDPAANELLVLQSTLRVTYTSPRTMHWITRLLKLLVRSDRDKLTESYLASELRNYARGKVRNAFFKDEQPQGFSISRIVFTYLDYLLWINESEAKVKSDFRFSFRNSIEHFYPQNPDKQQSGAAVSPERLHLLGNLALVSVGVNSKFSNNLPSVKAGTYEGTIEKQSLKLRRMAKITRENGRWGDEEVRAHHSEMVDLLKSDLGL